MIQLSELLTALDYDTSQYYQRTEDIQSNPSVAHIFRAADRAGVHGIYVFRASADDTLASRPAVYVAQAESPDDARQIHKRLWNLGQAPFLIVLLPQQIRVYTGFDYSHTSEQAGQIEEPIDLQLALEVIRERLIDFRAESVNTGRLWRARAKALNANQRVDTRLIKNLSKLGEVLRLTEGLRPEIAHALIGKYVYIRYLYDRKILSDEWLTENDVTLDEVLSNRATIAGLRKLVDALEARFAGNIFPLNFREDTSLTDHHVSLVASIFRGDAVVSDTLLQLSLDFPAYDFQYIPIETLSTIYEQFLHIEGVGKNIGAFYTPEYLADYLISELNSIRPLKRRMRILDPSCGSGVFLVLAYRQLIELELAKYPDKKIRPAVLREILLESLYGIERERDACYVAEFSLILTLLDYIEPPELHKNKRFKFPSLHNTHIFECDFFDDNSSFWKERKRFDWIVGNPPWIELKPSTQHEEVASEWITRNRERRPVGGNRVSEAFSWRIMDILQDAGIAGLILHAKSLFNHESKRYRQSFFEQHNVFKITNFSNLKFLFDGRAQEPAATVIYNRMSPKHKKPGTVHYGPFFVNQVPALDGGLWTITINESEIQVISSQEAARGDASTWKFAQWGTQRDKDAIERFRRLFPLTLAQFCEERRWSVPIEGAQLRNVHKSKPEDIVFVPALEGAKFFDNNKMNDTEFLFFIPDYVLKNIPDDMRYIRKRGGAAGFKATAAPHILLHASWKYIVYSEQDFVIPPRQIGISSPKEDAEYLRALSVYLSSSFVRYYLFFNTPEWGIERNRITLRDVRNIPVPRFTPEQVTHLAQLHRQLVEEEQSNLYRDRTTLLGKIDAWLAALFNIPEDITVLANDFTFVRLKLNRGEAMKQVAAPPTEDDLRLYAQQLSEELNTFIEVSDAVHRITVDFSSFLIRCTVELLEKSHEVSINENGVSIGKSDAVQSSFFSGLRDVLTTQASQWVYVQRGLRVFDGAKFHLYKAPRVIDWTRTQALNDADDIIAEVAAGVGGVITNVASR